MPRTDPSKFFDKYRSWQWIKHSILTDYLVVWARKVGSIARTIHIVDAFAGAGHYDSDDGATIEGSPVIEAKLAQQYKRQFPTRDITVFCIERDAANFTKLERAMEPFGSLVTVRRGDFYDHVDEIAARLKSDPSLILLDPIGLKAITADRCLPLLQRFGKTDLFVIVDFGIVHRAAGQLLPEGTPKPSIPGARRLGQMVDAFFGTTNWRGIATNPALSLEEKESRYLDFYFDNVLGNHYRFKSAYEVRSRHHGPIQYWLVHASNHEDAVWLMNDCIVKVDRALLSQTYEAPDQLPGIVEGTVAAYEIGIDQELRRAILAVLTKFGGDSTFRRLRRELLYDGFYGRVKESAYARAVKALVKEGKVIRQNRPGAKLELTEIIRLPALQIIERT